MEDLPWFRRPVAALAAVGALGSLMAVVSGDASFLPRVSERGDPMAVRVLGSVVFVLFFYLAWVTWKGPSPEKKRDDKE